MAMSFVESATLKLNEQQARSSVKKLNQQLLKLDRTNKKLVGSFAALSRELNKTTRSMDSLARSSARLNLDRQIKTTQAIRRLQGINAQLDALRAKTSRPFNVTTAARSVGGRPGGLASAAVGGFGIKQLIVYGAAVTIASGALKGFNERDIADARIAQQQLSPARQQRLDTAALNLAGETPGLNIAQARSLISENLASAQQNVGASAAISKAVYPLVRQQVALGKDYETALGEMSKIVRALEQTGRITTPEGDIDLSKLKGAVALEQAIASVLGVEYSGSERQRVAKLSRISGLTMNDPAVAALALLSEEQGTTAAVGYNQAIQNLTVRMTKKSEAALTQLGLRDGNQTKGERLLRTNLPQWIDQYLEPALAKSGVNVDDPAAVAAAVAKIAGDRTAQGAIASFLLRSDELERQTAEILRRQEGILSGADLGLDESSRIAFFAAREEFTGFLGTVVNQFEGPLIRGLNGAATAFQTLSGLTERLSDPMKELLSLLVPVGGAGAAFFGVRSLTGLATAGPALNMAAANLNTAAAALSRSAGAQGLGGLAQTLPNAITRGLSGKTFLITAALVKLQEQADKNLVTDPNDPDRQFLWQRTPQAERDRLRTSIGPQLPPTAQSLIQNPRFDEIRASLESTKPFFNEQFAMFDSLADRAAANVAALEGTSMALDGSFDRGTEDMRQAGYDFGQNVTSVLMPEATAFGQAVAAEIRAALDGGIPLIDRSLANGWADTGGVGPGD